MDFPATVVVHWPGESTAMCDEHRKQANIIAGAMGIPEPTATPVESPQECGKCRREHEKAQKG